MPSIQRRILRASLIVGARCRCFIPTILQGDTQSSRFEGLVVKNQEQDGERKHGYMIYKGSARDVRNTLLHPVFWWLDFLVDYWMRCGLADLGTPILLYISRGQGLHDKCPSQL